MQGDDVAIDRARRGDHDAFRVLVERHARPVFQLAFRMTGSEIDAEDMVQETFLKAWKQIGKFDGRATFGTWVHRICANCSLDHLRSRTRKQQLQAVSRDERNGGEADPLARIASGAPSPERLTLNSEITEILGEAMDELSAMERAAFVMHHYEGLSIEEISEALGVQTGAAKQGGFRAVQKLRRVLEPMYTP